MCALEFATGGRRVGCDGRATSRVRRACGKVSPSDAWRDIGAVGDAEFAPPQTQPPTRPRGRELGIPFPGTPGPLNAITDVAGVVVGRTTLVSGDSGTVVRGKGKVRTGVTAILPRAKGDWDFVMAATCNENGNGVLTGVSWVKESGFLEGPILLTGPHSVGTVRDAAIEWQIRNGRGFIVTYPLVTETSDVLNDATGAHVKAEHAWAALDAANIGPVREGGVSGGTGMSCNGFNGGIGTSSRQVPKPGGGHHTLGILVQCNYSGDLAIGRLRPRRGLQSQRTWFCCIAADSWSA